MKLRVQLKLKVYYAPPPPTTDYDFDFGEGFFIFDCQDVLGVSATPHPPSPLQLLSKTMLRAWLSKLVFSICIMHFLATLNKPQLGALRELFTFCLLTI